VRTRPETSGPPDSGDPLARDEVRWRLRDRIPGSPSVANFARKTTEKPPRCDPADLARFGANGHTCAEAEDGPLQGEQSRGRSKLATRSTVLHDFVFVVLLTGVAIAPQALVAYLEMRDRNKLTTEA
jgi:hypothetical protein